MRNFSWRLSAISIGLSVALFGASTTFVDAAEAPTTTNTGVADVAAPSKALYEMSDSEALDYLSSIAPTVLSAADSTTIDQVPPEYQANVRTVLGQLRDETGRKQLLSDIRAAEADPKLIEAAKGDLDAPATTDTPVPDSVIAGVNPSTTRATNTTKSGGTYASSCLPVTKEGLNSKCLPTRAPFPMECLPTLAKRSTVLARADVQELLVAKYGRGTGDPKGCGPDGSPPLDAWPVCPKIGTGTDPGKAAGKILTPTHDSFVSNGVGTVFAGDVQKVGNFIKVVVQVADPHKSFPVGALDVRVFSKTKLGSHASFGPFTARGGTIGAPSDSGMYCYPSNASGSRGYAVVYVPIVPEMKDPGFQLFAEITENDQYFEFLGPNQNPFDPNPNFDVLLSLQGPGYWTAGDQVMIHVGPAPSTTRPNLTPALGAFLDSDLLGNTDGNASNDPVSALQTFAKTKVDSFVAGFNNNGNDFVGEFLFDKLTPSGWTTTWDGEGQGSFSWEGGGSPGVGDWLGVIFGGLLAQILDIFFTARIVKITPGSSSYNFSWVPIPSPALGNGVRARGSLDNYRVEAKLRFFSPFNCRGSVDVAGNADMTAWVRPDPTTATNIKTKAAGSITNLKANNLWMPWYNWLRPSCITGWLIGKLLMKGMVKNMLTKALMGMLVGKADGTPGLLDKVVNEKINPAGTLAAQAAPVTMTAYRDTCPSGCTGDDSFGQSLGMDVMADGNFGTPGAGWGGSWPNLYNPPISGTIPSMIASHTDSAGKRRDVGAIVDGRFLQAGLHDIAATGQMNFTINGSALKHTIAPMYLPSETPLTLVLPDIEWSPGIFPKVRASIWASATLTLDPATRKLVPSVTTSFDVEAIDCLADYDNWYATSYAQCGHGDFYQGTLSQGISNLINQIAPLVYDLLLKGFKVPEWNNLLPGFSIAIGDTKVELRGGDLALYADRAVPAPAPKLTLSAGDAVEFTANATNFPGSGPITYTWKHYDINDAPNAPITGLCGNTAICTASPANFVIEPQPDPNVWVKATVVASRGGVSLTTSLTKKFFL